MYSSRPIFQLNFSGEVCNYFQSILEAESITGISSKNIVAACKGRIKHIGGYF